MTGAEELGRTLEKRPGDQEEKGGLDKTGKREKGDATGSFKRGQTSAGWSKVDLLRSWATGGGGGLQWGLNNPDHNGTKNFGWGWRGELADCLNVPSESLVKRGGKT